MSYYEKNPPKFVNELAFDLVKEFGMPGDAARELQEKVYKALLTAYIAGRNDQTSDDHWRSWDFGS